MISVSQAYRDAIAADNRHFYCEAVFTLYDNTTITVHNDKIWQNGFRIKQAVSGQSSFDLGACVINEFKLILNNVYGDFDGVTFDGAKVVANIGPYDADGNLIDIDGEGATTFSKGGFYVDEVDDNGSLITLTCLDAMANFDRDFADLTVSYPITLQNLAAALATGCGVPFTQTTFHNNAYSVTAAPGDTALTCRDVLGMIAQIAGSYATINADGELVFRWYDTDFLVGVVLDGGSFWHDIDSANGGAFWTGGDEIDGGSFHLADFNLSGLYKFSRGNSDISITGVEIIADDQSYLSGTSSYTFQIKDNLLINAGDEATIAADLGARLIGITFRPFEADHLSDPTLEPGDTIVIADHLGGHYLSVVTETEFSAGERQSTSCHAETPSQNAARRYTAAAKSTAVGVKNYDKTVNSYIDFVSNAYGMYRTYAIDPKTPSYGKVWIFHDAASVASSTFCVFEDGGGMWMGSRATPNSAWTFTATTTTDAACFGALMVRLLTASTAIVDQLFAQDIHMTGEFYAGPTYDGEYYYMVRLSAPSGSSAPFISVYRGTSVNAINTEIFSIDGTGLIHTQRGFKSAIGLDLYDPSDFPDLTTYLGGLGPASQATFTQPVFLQGLYGLLLYAGAGENVEAFPKVCVSNQNKDGALTITTSDIPELAVSRYDDQDDTLEATVRLQTDPSSGSVLGMYAKNESSGTVVQMGIGSDGVKHGIFSGLLNKWLLYGDASSAKFNGLSDGIDATATYTDGGTVGTATATWKAVQSVQLDPGVWYIEYGLSFASNANGFRAMTFSSRATSPGITRTANTMGAVSREATVMNSSTLLNVSATTTYYLYAYQNSGGNLNAYPFIRTIKLK